MTTKRQQNPAQSQLPSDIEKMLEKQLKQEKSRQEYNKRPDVKEKRKTYQGKQQRMRSIARSALKGDTQKLVSEYGFTEADANKMVEVAKKIKV